MRRTAVEIDGHRRLLQNAVERERAPIHRALRAWQTRRQRSARSLAASRPRDSAVRNAPLRSPSKTSPAPSRQGAPDRRRSRHQDHRARALRRRAPHRLAARHAAARAFSTDAEALTAPIFAEFDIAALVLGLPLDLDGRDGPRAQATRAFARNLSTRTDADRVLGRAVLDRRRHPGADRQRRLARPARRSHRQDGRGLYPARRPRPACACGRAFANGWTFSC